MNSMKSVLRTRKRFGRDGVLVDHLLRLLVDDEIHRLLDGELPLLFLDAHHTPENVSEVDFVAGSVAGSELYGLGLLLYLHLDGDAVEMSRAYLAEQFFFKLRVGLVRGVHLFADGQKQLDEVVLRDFRRAGHNLFELFFLDHTHGNLDKVADDAFHVPAHITDFREFGGFHLDERRAHEFREPARDFRLTHARGPFHKNVLGRDFFPHFLGKTAPSVTVAQRDCHRYFRILLPYDISVQFFDDLFGCKFHILSPQTVSTVMWSLVKTQSSDAILSARTAISFASRSVAPASARAAASA